MRGSTLNLRLRTNILIVCVVFVSGISMAQSKTKKPVAEPTYFYEEDTKTFDNSVGIPGNVLDAIRATEEVKSMQNILKDYDPDNFAHLFKAVVVHLHGSKETDYVLLSEYPLSGADAPWFWIVRYDPIHPKVIFLALAGGFRLLKTRNYGYPDIRSDAWTASIEVKKIYHYNGQKYMLVHKYEKER
jgi:hypothetical protein